MQKESSYEINLLKRIVLQIKRFDRTHTTSHHIFVTGESFPNTLYLPEMSQLGACQEPIGGHVYPSYVHVRFINIYGGARLEDDRFKYARKVWVTVREQADL